MGQKPTFPDLLTCDDGRPVADPGTWWRSRVPELWGHLERIQYGRRPDFGCLDVIALGVWENPFGFTQVDRLEFRSGVRAYLAVFWPDAEGPFPAFVGLNFKGIHTVWAESNLPVEPPNPAPPGSQAAAWPLELILGSGFALATAWYESFCPDDPSEAERLHAQGTTALSLWAEALTRIRSVVSLNPLCRAEQIVAIGHSRLGKAALLACARDGKFAACVPIQSGTGGAAPSRTSTGETVADITRVFPHWFLPEFAGYAGREDDLPIDQHALIALCAPRPILLLNAEEDAWANPNGQRDMLELAKPVYRLFGAEDTLEWHLRRGKHEVLPDDWERAIAFAKYRLKGRTEARRNMPC
ncbi:MAG: hypothetical protein N2109_00560 [Fimbriimonadales bacterium]|nr:hypothetical protein [Fimbriimonadales bacterium]